MFRKGSETARNPSISTYIVVILYEAFDLVKNQKTYYIFIFLSRFISVSIIKFYSLKCCFSNVLIFVYIKIWRKKLKGAYMIFLGYKMYPIIRLLIDVLQKQDVHAIFFWESSILSISLVLLNYIGLLGYRCKYIIVLTAHWWPVQIFC